MPKKKAATKSAAKAKAPRKKCDANKCDSHDNCQCEEIALDPVEEKALDLVQSSAKVQQALEDAAMESLSKAVRKVFKDHKVSLNPSQAKKIALVLFADGECEGE